MALEVLIGFMFDKTPNSIYIFPQLPKEQLSTYSVKHGGIAKINLTSSQWLTFLNILHLHVYVPAGSGSHGPVHGGFEESQESNVTSKAHAYTHEV